MQSDVGRRIGGYELVSRLGSGGFASVYRAEDRQLGTQVAIKVLHAHLARDEAFVRRFLAEARAVAHLRHPNISAILDVAETEDGRPYLVLSYVKGVTLIELIRGRGQLSIVEAAKILGPLSAALDYLHQAHRVCGLRKPSEVMIEDDGNVVLMGIEGTEGYGDGYEGLTAGRMVGNPRYTAPEQITGDNVSPATDIYVLALITYEMLTGRVPLAENSTSTSVIRARVLGERPVPIHTFNPGVPIPVEQAIEQALSREPGMRPASAGAFAAALQAALPAESPPATMPESSGTKRSLWRFLRR